MPAISTAAPSMLTNLSHPALGSTRLLKLGNIQLEVQTEVERGASLVTCVFARGRVIARRILPLPKMTIVDAHILNAAIKSEQKEIVGDVIDRLQKRSPSAG